MAARHWTEAQKAKQAKAIHGWKPWQHSTGARTIAGKAKVSMNAYRGGVRRFIRFNRWVTRTMKHPETLTPEMVEAAKHLSVELCDGLIGWLSEEEAKITEKYGLGWLAVE